MSIFKAYDIRGIYPAELNENFAEKIGAAFAAFVQAEKICVGRDARQSSPALAAALMRGITEQGVSVVDIGLCSTPLFSYAIATLALPGIMVTASHNPGQYNGFKLYAKNLKAVSAEYGMKEIERIVRTGIPALSKAPGKIEKKTFVRGYLAYLRDKACFKKKFTIVADAGNGMAGLTAGMLFKELVIAAKLLFFDIDCSFPNHEANPIKEENLKELQAAVKKAKADFGIAFDGDADRAGFIDDAGAIIPSDIITAVLAKSILKRHPGAKILYDIRSSWAVKEEILKHGGIPVPWKVGHSLIKRKMQEEDIVFGGEKSGHYYFKEFWYMEDPLLAMITLLNLLEEEGKKLSEVVKPLMRYHASGEINFTVKDKAAVLKKIEMFFKKEAKEINHLDGLTMEFTDWWFNVRPSNTEPLLRLNLEAKTKERMEEKRKMLQHLIGG